MKRSLIALVLVASALVTAGAQQARRVTLVSQVRDAMAAKDFDRAQALIAERRAAEGATPEVVEAVSWLGRGAQAAGRLDDAEKWAQEAYKLATAAHNLEDIHYVNALGAAIEVQALVLADRGARSEAITLLERELAVKRNVPGIDKRLQKNINLLTLAGHPAPALEANEWIGAKPPSLAALKGKVVVLFFWAHWCPDCKIEGPILDTLYKRYRDKGLTIVAPTQRFGYVAGGASAPPDQELRYIVSVRDQYYPWMANVPVPVSVANHERYGVSTSPTIAIVDRTGMVRVYHPGRMTEEELVAAVEPLLQKPS